MEIFQSIVAARVIFMLGIINLVTGALIAFTCRCAAGSKVTGKLMQYAGFKRLFSYQCHI